MKGVRLPRLACTHSLSLMNGNGTFFSQTRNFGKITQVLVELGLPKQVSDVEENCESGFFCSPQEAKFLTATFQNAKPALHSFQLAAVIHG